MKEGLTRIAIVLDRSGSMNAVRESTVAGFNEFIRAQRGVAGEARVRLVQFDDQYETVFDLPLAEVPELTQNSFVPRGWTALLDAQGRTIDELGRELAALPECERPAKVIVMTLTDGLENASKQYRVEQIADMVRHQTEKYGWDFVFLGANQDAVQTAATMAIPRTAALTYAANPRSTMLLMQAASDYVRSSRLGEQPSFSSATREAVLKDDDSADKKPAIPAPAAPPPARATGLPA